MTKQYVEIYYPGSFCANTTTQEISDKENFLLPEKAYAYKFFEKTEVETTEGEVLTGKRKNESGMFYKGKTYTIEGIKRDFPDEKTLIWNMETNNWSKVVRTVLGNFVPFREGDKIIV